MKRLKQLRESANYSQQHLASLMKTTQQTIARWESGKSEPNLAALRDLALIFGTSVDDLLGKNPLQSKAPSTTYHLFSGQAQDGFWGHVGLKFGMGPSRWFPVTAGTADRLRGELVNVEGENAWVSFATLANRFVAVRPAAIRKIWLLDDACDQPDGDWDLDLPYQGLPLEMYRAFVQLNDLPIDRGAWEAAAAAVAQVNDQGEPVGGDPAVWKAFLDDLANDFEGEASEAFLASIAETFIEYRLFDEDRYYRHVHHTELYFADGDIEHFWAEPDRLREFAFDVDMESVPTMIRLEHLDASAEPYYSAARVSAIVMPLIDLMDAWMADVGADDELEADD